VRRSAALLVLLCSMTLSASADEGDAPAPRLLFDNKIWDFGEIQQGRRATHAFSFRNLGTAPLVIRKVRPSCGCTVVKIPTAPIPPGGRGSLDVVFEAKTRKGFQSYRIFVFSNDAKEQDYGPFSSSLTLRGEVLTLFELSPQAFGFGRVVQGNAAQSALLARCPSKPAFKILEVLKKPTFVDLRWATEPKGVRIFLGLHSGAPVGRVEEVIVLKTNNKRQPELRIDLRGLVGTVFESVPSLHLDRIFRGSVKSLPLERSDQGKGLPVLGVSIDDSRFRVRWRELQTGRRGELELTVKPGAPIGPFGAELVIQLADPRQPRIVVPVTGTIARTVGASPPGILVAGKIKAGAPLARIELLPRRPGALSRIGAGTFSSAGLPATLSFERKAGRVFVVIKAKAKADALTFAGAAVAIELSGEPAISIPFVVKP